MTLPSIGQHGLQLFFHSDDWVVEVGSSPVSAPELLEHEDFLQRVLFDTAAQTGLVPHPRVGTCVCVRVQKPSFFSHSW